MAFASQQISVATTGHTLLIVQGDGTSGTFKNTSGAVGDELPCLIENHDGTNAVYVGGEGVTTSNGLMLAAGAAIPFQFLGTDAQTLSAVATGGAVTVGVLLGRQ